MSDAAYLHSSFFEQLVEHVFISELLQEAWYGFGVRMEVLRSEVDASGFDVVLECEGIVRHVQLKTSRSGGAAASQKVNIALEGKPSGCVIWLVREEDAVTCRARLSYLFFGGEPGKRLPPLDGFKTAKHTKGDSSGRKKERPNIRVVPKRNFEALGTTRQLVQRLFGLNERSPGLFLQTVNAFQRTAAIRAAVELDLFTGIAEGRQTAADLARHSGAAERGVRVLCDALAVMGFLEKRQGRYELTPDSAAFLDRRSPAYLGGVTEFLLAPQIGAAFAALTGAVRKGGTAMSAEGTVEANHPVWVNFARAMGGMMSMPAELLAKLVNGGSTRPTRVLDLAAGHGVFGIAFARLNPSAEVAALDWPAVMEVARENARAAGVEDRFATIGGSAFDADWGGRYDVILLANFLHHFDAPTCETLLRKARAALAEGGRAVALEFIPDEDRAGPPEPVMFALTMLATTPAGDAYTFAEYEHMFRSTGFARGELHPLPPTMERVVIGYA